MSNILEASLNTIRAMPIGYWATNRFQSFFVAIFGKLSVNIRSQPTPRAKLKPNESNAQYTLQLNPIFAVTGIFRIFITYGFWQGVRNGHPENKTFFGDDHLTMNFINGEGDLASWFNLCGLVWFFSGMFSGQFRGRGQPFGRLWSHLCLFG